MLVSGLKVINLNKTFKHQLKYKKHHLWSKLNVKSLNNTYICTLNDFIS